MDCVGVVVDLARQAATRAYAAKQLRDDCVGLAQLIDKLCDVLQAVHELLRSSDWSIVQRVLQDLRVALQDASEFVETTQSYSFLRLACQSGLLSAKLAGVKEALMGSMATLMGVGNMTMAGSIQQRLGTLEKAVWRAFQAQARSSQAAQLQVLEADMAELHRKVQMGQAVEDLRDELQAVAYQVRGKAVTNRDLDAALQECRAELLELRGQKQELEDLMMAQIISLLDGSGPQGCALASQEPWETAGTSAGSPRSAQPPPHLLCPISHELMEDPVMLVESGHTFDRRSIQEWLGRGNAVCPISRKALSSPSLVPVYALRDSISHWRAAAGTGSSPMHAAGSVAPSAMPQLQQLVQEQHPASVGTPPTLRPTFSAPPVLAPCQQLPRKDTYAAAGTSPMLAASSSVPSVMLRLQHQPLPHHQQPPQEARPPAAATAPMLQSRPTTASIPLQCPDMLQHQQPAHDDCAAAGGPFPLRTSSSTSSSITFQHRHYMQQQQQHVRSWASSSSGSPKHAATLVTHNLSLDNLLGPEPGALSDINAWLCNDLLGPKPGALPDVNVWLQDIQPHTDLVVHTPAASMGSLPAVSSLYRPQARPAAPFPDPAEQILALHVPGNGAIVFGISWSASGTKVHPKMAVAANDRWLRVWERVPNCTSTPSRVMRANNAVPARVACHPHSSLIAATYLDKRVRVWDGADLIYTSKDLWGANTPFFARFEADQHLAAVRWCPQGLRLAAATTRGKGVVVWEAGDRAAWEGLRGAEPLLLCRHSAATCAVAWGPEGGRLAWGADDGRLGVCDVGRPGEVLVALGGREAIWSIDWNWAGVGAGGAASTGCVAAGGRDKAVRLWDVSSGAQAGVLVGHSSPVTEVAWRPGDAYTMASVCMGGRVIVWDVRTCRALQSLQFHNRKDGRSPVVGTSVAWSPDGAMLAAGAHDGQVMAWG